MSGNGDMNPVPAMSYGLIFSVINVALAVSAGFFCTRYLTFRQYAEYPDMVDAKIRWLARSGLCAHIGLLLLLVFTTLRVRATGHHQGIFDFNEVGFFATFDSGFSLAILGISFLSTLIGVYEGRHGFSDVVPGYTQVQRRAENLIDDQAGELTDHTLESLEEISESGIEEVHMQLQDRQESLQGFNAEIESLRADIAAYNNDVQAAQDQARVFAQELMDIDAKAPDAQLLKTFNALLLRAKDLPNSSEEIIDTHVIALEQRITSACDQAIAHVMAAHAEYLTSKPHVEFPEPAPSRDYRSPQATIKHIGGSSHA